MPLLNYLFGVPAAIGFALALTVHSLTFTQTDVQSDYPSLWLLHVGCFIVFLPFIIASRRELGSTPGFSQLRATLPGWANVLAVCVFAYAIINFGLFFLHSEGGTPAVKGGTFVLQSHGKMIRELSTAEYQLQKNYVVRGFSGHWLVFYLVPTLYFLARLPRRAAEA